MKRDISRSFEKDFSEDLCKDKNLNVYYQLHVLHNTFFNFSLHRYFNQSKAFE